MCFLIRVLDPGCAGFFYIWAPGDSPCLLGAKDLGATLTPWWGQEFPLRTAAEPVSALALPTHTQCFSLQALLPKEPARAIVWIFQIPWVAWEYRPQIKSQRRRKVNLAPDQPPPPTSWVVLGVSLSLIILSLSKLSCPGNYRGSGLFFHL